jgi:hypothetical protein
VTLGLLSYSPNSKAISEFLGMIASTLSLSWIPIWKDTRFYIPCLKMMIFRWWKNAPRMFSKFLFTDEHNQCKIHLSPSPVRMVSNRSIPISLPSQVEPHCTLPIAYTPFLQCKGDPPTSYGYVKVITTLSLHLYPYIHYYKFSAHDLKILMLSHKQINENMVTRHQKSVDMHNECHPACIWCISDKVIHEHGNALHDMGIWKPGFGPTCIHPESFTLSTLVSLQWWCCDPWTKVPRWNLVYHVCCSHVITTRSTLGIFVCENATHSGS